MAGLWVIERTSLLFSPTEPLTALPDARFILVGKRKDPVVHRRRPRGLRDLLLRHTDPSPVRNVVTCRLGGVVSASIDVGEARSGALR